MAADHHQMYYDKQHFQADCLKSGICSGTSAELTGRLPDEWNLLWHQRLSGTQTSE